MTCKQKLFFCVFFFFSMFYRARKTSSCVRLWIHQMFSCVEDPQSGCILVLLIGGAKLLQAALSQHQLSVSFICFLFCLLNLSYLDVFGSFFSFLITCVSSRKGNSLKKIPNFCCGFKVSFFSDKISFPSHSMLVGILKHVCTFLFSSVVCIYFGSSHC